MQQVIDDGRFESAQPQPQPLEAAAAKNYGWILNPTIDIMFACGGMMWLLWLIVDRLGIQISTHTPQGTALWLTTIIGIHFFSNDHAFIGWFRVVTSKYIKPEVKKRLGYLAISFLLLLFPVILIPGWAAVAAKIYVFWLVQHYAAQAYGITMIYCLKRNYIMTKTEKELMHLVFRLLVCMVLARAMTYPEFSGYFFENLKLPFWGPLPMWLYDCVKSVFAASVLVFAGMITLKYFKEKILFPFPALMNMASIIGIYVVANVQEPVLGIFMAAFFHGTQNFVIGTAVHLKERGLPDSVPTSKISSLLLKPYTIRYFFSIVAMGILITVVFPRALMLLSVPLQITIAGVFSLQGFHHFITESIVWKLRHPDIRKLLIA